MLGEDSRPVCKESKLHRGATQGTFGKKVRNCMDIVALRKGRFINLNK
jgi:hypothetical protein